MTPETNETLDEIKARGGFYTPPELTTFLATWAIRVKADKILEPSCGDGAFLAAAARRFALLGRTNIAGHVFGVELDENEAAKAKVLAPGAKVTVSSFFDVQAKADLIVDAVIGNPPYIRYHGFTGDNRRAGLARASEQGVKLSNLASSWAHFLIHAAAFVDRDHGRLGLVLPAELLHTDYAAPVRFWLLEHFKSVVLVTFDRSAFKEAQVDALLLLASNDGPKGLHVLRVKDETALASLDLKKAACRPASGEMKRWSGAIDARAEAVYLAFVAGNGVQRLGQVASVDIGVVTGANKFFIMTAEEAQRRRIPPRFLTPILRTTSDTSGMRLLSGETSRLLLIHGKNVGSKMVLRYLAEGERNLVTEGYKCRTRTPWYRVPLPRAKPDAFLPYMNNRAPRLIVNAQHAWSTNLVHGVKLKPKAPKVMALSAAMLSSATMLSAEIEGRAYGGGVLKLETKEAERLAIPAMTAAQEARLVKLFPELDRLVRAGRVDEASAKVDKVLGLDRTRLLEAYSVFRSRRLERKAG